MLNLLAQNIKNPIITGPSASLSGEAFFSKLVGAIISLMLVIGAVVFVFMLISGGIAWITAGGDKSKLERAQHTVMNAVVGLIVLMCVYGIVNLIENFLGFSVTYFDISKLGLGY